MARALDPATVQTPALDLIDAALVEAFNTRNARLVIAMPPQEGKSERASRRFPLWALTQNPDLRIAIASFEHDTARRWGRVVRDDITMHSADLGLKVRDDMSAQAEWALDGHKGGLYCVGVGGALTGRPVDLMIIDDPMKGHEQADSPTHREKVWDWWTGTVATRFSPTTPVIVIQTRWHPDDLAGRLLNGETADRWKLLSIPAQCEDPENDPLGRTKIDEFMVSARGRTQDDWELRKADQAARTWAALYQQRPAPAEGAVWRWPWIETNRGRTGDVLLKLAKIVVGVDPAATSKRTSDLTGISVAGIDSDGEAWVLDDRTIRGTPIEWGVAVWDAVMDWGAHEVVIEDNQGGEMVLEVMRSAWREIRKRRRINRLAPPVRRVHPTAGQGKRARAESVAAFYEVGKVHHAADGTDRLSKVEDQMITWTGTGDSPDRIDALVHALTALFLPQHSDAAVPAKVTRHNMRGR